MWSGGITRRDLIAASAATVAATPGWATLSPAPIPQLDFLVVGDWGRDGKAYQRHVAARMAIEAIRIDASFVVSTGDNFYNLGVSSRTDSQWDTSFEAIYVHDSLQTTWYPVLGNHDYGGDVTAQLKRTTERSRWQMPDRWHKICFDKIGQPRVDLFFIDTVVWAGKESLPFNLFGSSLHKGDQNKQKIWLSDHLSASNAPIKLVFGHHPIYSIGKHGGKANFDDLDQLLRRYGVTAYVNGHDHCLYHIQSPKMDYICSGGGSQELLAFSGDRNVYGRVLPENCPSGAARRDPPRWLSFVDRAGFASFSVTEQGLTFRLIDRSGVVFHETTIPARPRDPNAPIGCG